MILWIGATQKFKKASLEGSVETANRSLEFLGHPLGLGKERPVE